MFNICFLVQEVVYQDVERKWIFAVTYLVPCSICVKSFPLFGYVFHISLVLLVLCLVVLLDASWCVKVPWSKSRFIYFFFFQPCIFLFMSGSVNGVHNCNHRVLLVHRAFCYCECYFIFSHFLRYETLNDQTLRQLVLTGLEFRLCVRLMFEWYTPSFVSFSPSYVMKF